MADGRGRGGGVACGGALLLASGVLFAPLPAAANSCSDEGLLAAPQSSEVPTNTLIWCTLWPEYGVPSTILRDAEGRVVSGTDTEISLNAMRQVVFRPDAELEPNSEYTYVCPGRSSEDRFTTGAGPSTTAPAVPDLSRREERAVIREGLGASYEVAFAEPAEIGRLVVFDIGGEAALDSESMSGVVSDAKEMGLNALVLGSGGCVFNWPEASLGASTTVALGAFDLTGAFSGWSETVRVTIPSTLEDLTAEEASEAPDPVAPEGALEPAALEPTSDISTPSASLGEAPSRSEAGLSSGCSLGSSSRMPRFTAFGAAILAALVALRRRP